MAHIPPYIDRMNDLAEAALKHPEGILILQPNKPEALRNRQRFYSARRDLKQRQPYSSLALVKVETCVEEHNGQIYWKIFPAGLVQKAYQIFAAGSMEPITIQEGKPEGLYEDEVFELMLELAEKRGTKKEAFESLREEAEGLWAEGRRAKAST